ncbi:hypothetical protein KI387_005285, partial [Taxus chinensis]
PDGRPHREMGPATNVSISDWGNDITLEDVYRILDYLSRERQSSRRSRDCLDSISGFLEMQPAYLPIMREHW